MPEQNGRLEIREMKETDLPEVARIEKENFSLPWSGQGFAAGEYLLSFGMQKWIHSRVLLLFAGTG